MNVDNVIRALNCISGGGAAAIALTPNIIKEAESALLSWENSNPSTYAINLLQIITMAEATTTIIPRLAAALSLKAMIGRKWKDRGRLSKKTPLLLIDNDTKEKIRNVLLSILTTGGANAGNGGNGTSVIMDRNLSISLIRDKTFMVSTCFTLGAKAKNDESCL